MNDPIVKSLFYDLKFSDSISFDKPPPLEIDNLRFKCKLENYVLYVQMNEFFATETQARMVVDSFLKAWELNGLLESNHKDFWFVFNKSIIVDRTPSKNKENKILHVETGNIVLTGHAPTIHITRRNYPPPPINILYSPDVDSLTKRFEGFITGAEPLLSMAYFCLTVFESQAKDRLNVCTKFNIHPKVISKLGELTSNRGDILEARKFNDDLASLPLTMAEKDWIISSVKALIRRKAEYDFNPSAEFQQLTMETLPSLPG